MDLESIHDKVCSVCGATPVSESKKNQHTCGLWNEAREFECGAVLRFSPNYNSLHGCTPCPKHPDTVAKNEKRKEAKRKVEAYIKRLSVDKSYKERMLGRLEYV